jgi:hypothetical protein
MLETGHYEVTPSFNPIFTKPMKIPENQALWIKSFLKILFEQNQQKC